ncbi:MAG: hypothetical protein K1X86_15860 [Ignavibacteria bacterium]|nr:hypothetical protein [Ignavibacteria bacterium]
MTDTKEYLPKSRALFRKFINAHLNDYFKEIGYAKVGPGTGYPFFYRDNEVIQHLRDITYNLEETFGYVTIPEEFPSPKALVKTWQWMHDFLFSKNELFEDVLKTSEKDKKRLPEPFSWIHKTHNDVLELLQEILEMEEVKKYLDEINKKGEKEILSKEFDVAIITALHDHEFEALKNLPCGFTRFVVKDDATNYLRGEIDKKTVLIATDNKMGLAASAV